MADLEEIPVIYGSHFLQRSPLEGAEPDGVTLGGRTAGLPASRDHAAAAAAGLPVLGRLRPLVAASPLPDSGAVDGAAFSEGSSRRRRRDGSRIGKPSRPSACCVLQVPRPKRRRHLYGQRAWCAPTIWYRRAGAVLKSALPPVQVTAAHRRNVLAPRGPKGPSGMAPTPPPTIARRHAARAQEAVSRWHRRRAGLPPAAHPRPRAQEAVRRSRRRRGAPPAHPASSRLPTRPSRCRRRVGGAGRRRSRG